MIEIDTVKTLSWTQRHYSEFHQCFSHFLLNNLILNLIFDMCYTKYRHAKTHPEY